MSWISNICVRPGTPTRPNLLILTQSRVRASEASNWSQKEWPFRNNKENQIRSHSRSLHTLEGVSISILGNFILEYRSYIKWWLPPMAEYPKENLVGSSRSTGLDSTSTGNNLCSLHEFWLWSFSQKNRCHRICEYYGLHHDVNLRNIERSQVFKVGCIQSILSFGVAIRSVFYGLPNDILLHDTQVRSVILLTMIIVTHSTKRWYFYFTIKAAEHPRFLKNELCRLLPLSWSFFLISLFSKFYT